MVGNGTKDRINELGTGIDDSQGIDKNGGREGIRTPGLLVANDVDPELRHAASIT